MSTQTTLAHNGFSGSIRSTRQKSAIRSAFERTKRPLSPAEVLTLAAREASGLGIATVYRNIKTLVTDGWLTPVDLPGEAPRYEITTRTRHNHFYCKSCGKVFDVGLCDVNTKKVLPRGFKLAGHQTLLYGSCSECIN